MRPLSIVFGMAVILAPTFARADMLDRCRDASVAQATRMHET